MPKNGTPWLAQTVQLFKTALKNFDDGPDQTIDLQVGKTVWHNVAPKMRTELWLSILHRKGIGSKAAKRFREYLGKVGTRLGRSKTKATRERLGQAGCFVQDTHLLLLIAAAAHSRGCC